MAPNVCRSTLVSLRLPIVTLLMSSGHDGMTVECPDSPFMLLRCRPVEGFQVLAYRQRVITRAQQLRLVNLIATQGEPAPLKETVHILHSRLPDLLGQVGIGRALL